MFPCFAIDQIVHIFFISAIFFFPMSRQPAPVNHFYTLFFMAFITAAFAGGYFLHAFRKSYLSGARPDHFISSKEMVHGIIERGVITGVFLFSGHPIVWLGSLSVGLLRIPFKKLRNRTDFILNFLWAAAVGLAFRRLMEIL